MSRFAKIEEEAVKRQAELSGEEWRLYCIIKFHTFSDTGMCRKNLREISALYSLEYHNTTRRYKKLRKLGWCANEKKGIRPLIGLESVKNTPEIITDEESVNFTPLTKPKSVKTTLSKCKNYTENESKSVKTTLSPIPYIEPFKDQNLSRAVAAEKNAAAAANSNGHQSKFSIEECFRYAEICVKRGESIKNPHGLAMTAYQTGTHDVFIQARLYPEQPEAVLPVTAAAAVDISEKRREALAILTDMKAEGEDISTMKHWYEDDWAWLEEQLKTG